ncbi:hypothetical protein ALON55S_00262 [Alishewanella longhuensis]
MQIVRMMDVPHARGRDIRLLSLVYMAPQQLITQLQELMLAEDISTNTDVSFCHSTFKFCCSLCYQPSYRG